MRIVQFDHIEADAERTLGSADEGFTHACDVVERHLARHMPALAERQRRWRDGRPGILVRPERTAPLPRPLRGGLAAGVRELNTELGGADTLAVIDHMLE